jgi:hypothetical protein
MQMYNPLAAATSPPLPLEAVVPPDKAWVLRNLNARELVRAEALALSLEVDVPQAVCQESLGRLGLWGCRGAARTRFRGYGAAASLSNKTRTNVSDHAGLRAGHCFDISTRERHERERRAELGLWKDVSDEVAQELKRLWTEHMRQFYNDDSSYLLLAPPFSLGPVPFNRCQRTLNSMLKSYILGWLPLDSIAHCARTVSFSGGRESRYTLSGRKEKARSYNLDLESGLNLPVDLELYVVLRNAFELD